MFTKIRTASVLLGAIGAWLVALNGAVAAPPPDDRFHLRELIPPTPKATCGVYAFYACARASGRTDINPEPMQQAFSPIGPQGVSAAVLAQFAQQHQLLVQPVHVGLETLTFWNQPAVLHVLGTHYIAFLGQENGRLIFLDPSLGLFDCTPAWFAEHYRWEGITLVFGRPPSRWLALLEWPAMVPLGIGLFVVAFFLGILRSGRSPRAGVQGDIVRVSSGSPCSMAPGDV